MGSGVEAQVAVGVGSGVVVGVVVLMAVVVLVVVWEGCALALGGLENERVGVPLLDVVFVGMDGLLVLPEVVQTGEVLGAVGAGEGPFACVLSAVPGEVFQAGEGLVAVGEARALEHPTLGWALWFLVCHTRSRDEAVWPGRFV